MKTFQKNLKILDNTSLFIKKIQNKDSGLYTCYLNTSSSDYETTLTSHYESYSYFIHIFNEKNQSKNGTYTEWNYYEGYVYRSCEKMMQSIPLINDMFKPSLIVHWSAWGDCLCGKYKYDTRSYRNAHCCTKLFHGLILPCQSLVLKEVRPEISKILETVANFKEYRRCMEDCVPGKNDLFLTRKENSKNKLFESRFGR